MFERREFWLLKHRRDMKNYAKAFLFEQRKMRSK
jgi:hypothetical protein